MLLLHEQLRGRKQKPLKKFSILKYI
ncbi:hypothetical protein C5167_000756 [Papaver somniferum]|uniref:Uncharacterized protein n=1 Tax=Papaver somniferum TaxID=3469 RepID=A0A4Y7KW54_PAPSO|nr:hypothetical protein C5167_000756 [Papaver somniferum]